MSRLFYANASGALGANLTANGGDNTITFGSGPPPPFATLAVGDYIPIMIGSGLDTTAGFEIVWLTSYTAGDYSGSITREAEDSINWPVAAHTAGDAWWNAPTILDKTQIFFSAYRAAALSLGAGTTTAITFDTVNWSTGGDYAITQSGSELEVNLTGWYLVNARFGLNTVTGNDRFYCSINVSGTEMLRGDDHLEETEFDVYTCSGVVYVEASGGYIQVAGYNSAGSSEALAIGISTVTVDISLLEVA